MIVFYGLLGIFTLLLALLIPDMSWELSHARNIKQVLIMLIPLWLWRAFWLLLSIGLLSSAAALMVALLNRLPIVIATDEWIEARTWFGGRRRLTWTAVTDVMACNGQIVLATGKAGVDAQIRAGLHFNDSMVTWEYLMLQILGATLWKPDAVVINPKLLDVEEGAIERQISRYKPDLVIRKIRFM